MIFQFFHNVAHWLRASPKGNDMAAMLLFALAVLLVAWALTLVVAQIRGVPEFVPTVIWACAVIVIVVRLTGAA